MRSFFKDNFQTLIEPLPGLIMLCCSILYQYQCEEYDFDDLYRQKKKFDETEKQK